MTDSPRTYSVSAAAREPLVRFMVDALRTAGCRILHEPTPDTAPFRITFERPSGERMGIVAYAFLATRTPTRNRPIDERSFQLKYGSKTASNEHEIWQDPYGLYTTLLLGIDPKDGYFVAFDPVLRSRTKHFIRLEFKDHHAERILHDGWAAWERDRRSDEEPVEVVVGGRAERFLPYVLFEREAAALETHTGRAGPRQLLAERILGGDGAPTSPKPRGKVSGVADALVVPPPTIHRLSAELALGEREILDMILGAKRLKMAVRGWAAERHLVEHLRPVAGVVTADAIDLEGKPDVQVVFEGHPLTIECKNVLRETTRDGTARVDFQRTRASKSDPCSRYYRASDFDLLAACMHSVTERWEFRFALPTRLDPHPKCTGRLSSNVRVAGDRWIAEARRALLEAVRAA